jgi:hypothetical protein
MHTGGRIDHRADQSGPCHLRAGVGYLLGVAVWPIRSLQIVEDGIRPHLNLGVQLEGTVLIAGLVSGPILGNTVDLDGVGEL